MNLENVRMQSIHPVHAVLCLAVAGIATSAGIAHLIATPAAAQTVNTGATRSGACEQLASLPISQGTINSVEALPSGKFTMDAGGSAIRNLGAFCRVRATLTPSADSDIKIEVWLPEVWNGKLQVVGNGGWAGSISYTALAMAVQDGYAAVSTDTGHVGANGSFAPGHPEKMIDFSYRSAHEMSVKAKQMVASYYGSPPKYSYWNGCSTGGRQGLVGAIRYPEDFDGIVIGSPVNPRAAHNAWELAIMLAIQKNPASAIPDSKFEILHRAVMDACDSKDGLKDGLLGNPERCDFKPETLTCKAGDRPQCLTKDQIGTVRLILSPLRAKGRELYAGLPFGSELNWAALGPDDDKIPSPAQSLMDQGLGPDWDWKNFNAERDLAALDKLDALQSAMTSDLSAFTSRGGKVLIHSGWSSSTESGLATAGLFKDIVAKSKNGANSARLFMVPGMGHCGGGAGATDKYNAMAALAHWVESGVAPQQLTAAVTVPTFSARSGQQVSRSRPLCAYPQIARYNGKGNPEEAANFTCKAP